MEIHRSNLAQSGLRYGLVALIAAVMLLFPVFVTKPYYLHIFIMSCFGSVCAISWRFIRNMGQINFGPAGFIGIGAYTSALFVMKLGFSFWLALPISGLMSALIAILIGYPTLRLRGLYFAITTFAFQEVLRTIWLRFKVPFGGPTGIYNIPFPDSIPLGFGEISFNTPAAYYYLAFFLLVVTVLFFSKVDKTRFGLTLGSIRESDNLAESVGVNLMRYQLLGWTIASFFTGLAGSFYAHYIRFIDPFTFSEYMTVDIIAYSIVGGLNFAWSPILGAFVLVSLSETLRSFGGHYAAFFIGLALMAFVILSREGVTHLALRLIGLSRHKLPQHG